MNFETILLDVSGGIARLTLNRPDRLNSFNVQMHDEVRRAFDHIHKANARVVVLTGAGRGFCAGQDLSDRAVAPSEDGVDLGESLEVRYNPLVKRIATLEMPVVCAVNGVAAGAGANIALACDIVIAARSAKFIQSFANIGLIPDSGGTWTLPRGIGLTRALGAALTGEPVSAERAESWGMIWKCVDDDKLASEVDALATKFASAPTKGLACTKKLIRESAQHSFEQQLLIERDTQRRLGHTQDYREGVAAFLEKRTPNFTGH
ncbi:MAG: 2-(1,2-epoxy-1,2-dihydrophenyl)acetyl-CoA isomerase [Caulobacterales bacterium]|jgi:2-(1,2-epoxy-1,2-dihydrophenyl)acetyl-CoA isomerase|nr:2-(1,2-epoxy-1,2-dihydrophenyl)acetyl-CoA isomerase [Caulobacterales bacterium]